MQVCADDQGTLCIVFAFSFTSYYESNVLPQFGMSQYDSLNVQALTRFQSSDSFTRND